MIDPGAIAMRARRYAPLALAATGLVALVVAAVLVFQSGDDGGEPGGLAGAAPAAAPAIGDTAGMTLHDAPRELPELRFTDGSGKPLSLADFRGKLVLLNLWATWCGPCREEMPTLDRLQAELGGPDFEVVALSIDRAGIAVVDAFYAEIGVGNLARYIDESGRVTQELSALGLPTTLLLDREGREIARHVGPAEWDRPAMVAFFRRQLGQNPGTLLRQAAVMHADARTMRAVSGSTSTSMYRLAISEEGSR
jgi:thiol-disulfide isomerase/thioredoxin